MEGPVPFRPRFTRPRHHWPTAVWLLGLVSAIAAIAAGAAAGLWIMPFAGGAAAGLANRVGRWPTAVALPAAVLAGATGWAVALGWSMLRGRADAAVARAVAVSLGLPASAAAAVALTILVAAAQSAAGYWLGRALTPLPVED